MDAITPSTQPAHKAPSHFQRNQSDRARMKLQFDLLREDLNLWLDEMLRMGGLCTDPIHADWSVLVPGSDDAQFTDEIIRRYPNAHVRGLDVTATAGSASTESAAIHPGARSFSNDAGRLRAGRGPNDGGFDAAVMWMVLPFLADKAHVLANLCATLRPGGVLLLGYVPDEFVRLNYPPVAELMAARRLLAERLGAIGLADMLAPLLSDVGFGDVRTEMLRYSVGGATTSGQRWYECVLANIAARRDALVNIHGLMDEKEYDRVLARFTGESVLRVSGEVRFLVTLARRL